MIPSPPPLESLPAGAQLHAGLGLSTILPDIDWETRSEAGWVWSDETNAWEKLPGAPKQKSGLSLVGTAVYATHPSTRILSFAYNLKGWNGIWGRKHWKPGDTPPFDLFEYIATGGLVEAHKSDFEHWIWNHVAVTQHGWPPLPLAQLRCSMAKAKAHAMPPPLEKLAKVLQVPVQKNAAGKRLIDKYSVPRDPTGNNPARWNELGDNPADALAFYDYNLDDISAESHCSARLPDLSPPELEYWLNDQAINYRGIGVDIQAVADCIEIIEQATTLYNAELALLTGGQVTQASQNERLLGWLAGKGVHLGGMAEEIVTEALKDTLMPWDAHRALTIRSLLASASIKKLFTIRNQTSKWGRVHELFGYHAARTGRDAGYEAQPQNLPRTGPEVYGPSKAWKGCCGRHFGAHRESCPWCGQAVPLDIKSGEWSPGAVEDALEVISWRSLKLVEEFFGDALYTIAGCVRGVFVAAEGYDLIASDYSAIEAVVLACLSGCDWRIQTFRKKRDIYLASAARTTGNTYEFYIEYKENTGKHHPHRQPFGKVLELALGYGGWVNAVINFGGDKYFTPDEMVRAIKDWRAESPEIVEFWGGQFRGMPWDGPRNGMPMMRPEYYGLEGAAIQAILNPGKTFTVLMPHECARPISYVVKADVLYCILPDGKELTYHQPRLEITRKGPYAGHAQSITFWGWNTNQNAGGFGWIKMDTYGPKLAENVVQAVSRQILRDAVNRFMRRGYDVVLRVHDEIVAEILKLFGSIEEFEAIMQDHDPLYHNWPVRAAGGWRGRRYRKDG